MADLSSISSVTRKIVEIGTVSVVAIILLMLGYNGYVLVKNAIAPTPPKPPDVRFGKIPAVSFPLSSANNTYSYTINTLSGSLPDLPSQIAVYAMDQAKPDLLGLDKATTLAQNANFPDPPTQLSVTKYQWTTQDPLPTTLTLDTQTFDFLWDTQYMDNQAIIEALHIPDQSTAQDAASNFFNTFIPLPIYIDSNKTKTTLFAINGEGLVPASSLSTAQIVRIDYFPKAIDTYPIYTDNPNEGLIYMLLGSGPTDTPQIVKVQYYHKAVSGAKGMYPIISASQALDLLKKGDGFIAADPTNATAITITGVSLGYYETSLPQKYLWPIIVFQGDQGFYAYVNALPGKWVQEH